MKTKLQFAVAATTRADELLNHVWNHMHGVNMDGKGRHGHRVQREKECAENWQKLSDAIGVYLSEGEE